ncbi:hypothetical protein [Paraglaciecola sp.]|uniref:hypothetical protein n=1 Tax=Paraglaciecola sp. TaxID=1920173 RepID=UPI003264DFF2
MDFQLRVTAVKPPQPSFFQSISSLIQAQASSVYTLVDSKGQVVVADLVLSRKGDDLEVVVDGDQATTIEDFYGVAGSHYGLEGAAQSALDSASVPGDMVLASSGDAVIAEGLVWQATEAPPASQLWACFTADLCPPCPFMCLQLG